MTELLQAAKTVLEYWDADVTDNLQDEAIERLRAAVERAELPLTKFEEWADNNNLSAYGKACSRKAWQAAQQAERERIRAMIRNAISGFGKCHRLVEKINEPDNI